MKRALSVFLLVFCLSGCSNQDVNLNKAVALRESVISAEKCSFIATVTADYVSESYTFKMKCESDAQGNVNFTVLEPDSIDGITGQISNEGGKLTFDDKYLVFAPLVDGQITPVSAPWLFLKTLKSGYISGCAKEKETSKIYFDDIYQDEKLTLITETDNNNIPYSAEIYFNGRRTVTMLVENFTIM